MASQGSFSDYNDSIDQFRDVEYPMMQGAVYLDHAGTTIPAKSLIETFSNDIISNLYGNPHSLSTPATLTGRVLDGIRLKALKFLKADREHFDLIFTANATAAIKLVAECFRDLGESSSTGTFSYTYHKDSHTSIVGVRELSARSQCLNDEEVEAWLHKTDPHLGLFAYPGQSNMTGRRLPHWSERVRKVHTDTYTLLDAAALASNSQINLSCPDTAPDFTVLSWYKIFGFPDLGALIVRKKSAHILFWRKYFGGGTIDSATVRPPSYNRKVATIHEGLEDGTLPFHNIIALGHAITVHRRLFGSMETIEKHTRYLGRRLYEGLRKLPCEIYGYGTVVAFNVLRGGVYVPYSEVERLADEAGIYLRAGGLCNPGGIASHLGFEPWHFKRAWSAGHRCGGIEVTDGKPMGVVRVSVGAMSTLADVDRFLDWMRETFAEEAFPRSEDVVMWRKQEMKHKDFLTRQVSPSSAAYSILTGETAATVLSISE